MCHEGVLARPLFIVDRLQDVSPNDSFEDCVRKGNIEYVSPQEQYTLTRIAMTPKDIDATTTHVEICHAAFLGRVGAHPFHSPPVQQTARLSLVLGQIKQNIASEPLVQRGAANSAQLLSSFKPLCQTQTSQLSDPNRSSLLRGTAMCTSHSHGFTRTTGGRRDYESFFY